MTELLSPGQLERSRVVREEELHQFFRGLVESGKKKEVVNMGAELMKLKKKYYMHDGDEHKVLGER